MREKKIETIVKQSAVLGTKAENLIKVLNSFQDEAGRAFDIDRTIVGRDSSVAQVAGRIQVAVGMVAEFNKATRAELVPLQVLNDLEVSITETISAIDGLMKMVDEILRSQDGLKSFDYSNFHALAKNGNNNNMHAHFDAVFDKSETFLQRFFASLHILKPRTSFSFQSAASGISAIISEASKTLLELKESLKKVVVSEKNLASKEQEATAHLDEIKRLKTDGAADRKTVSEYLAEVTQHKASVQAISDEASSLQIEVKAYEGAFSQFRKQLDERETIFKEGTEKLDGLIGRSDEQLHALIKHFEEQRDGVEELMDRSEEMLSSATVSGLAANFSTMMNKLTKELWWARFAFYVGIAFLTISAIPLLAFVLLPIVAPFLKNFSTEMLSTAMHYGPGSAQTGWQYLGQVLARITILLPAAWFVSFTAIRHSSLFRLREHYAYKYSMAVAVEGFKKQAPDYEQEIAALVLGQLAFNPADKLVPSKEIKEGKAPGLAGHILTRIRDKLEQQASEDTTN